MFDTLLKLPHVSDVRSNFALRTVKAPRAAAPLRGQHAAVDRQQRAGDVRRRVAGQEDRRGDELARLALPRPAGTRNIIWSR